MFKKNNMLVLFVSIFLCGALLSLDATVAVENKKSNNSPDTVTVPYDDLRILTKVFGRIKRDYVEVISDKKLLEYAIQGMLSGLDPHSSYLNQEQYKALQESTTGQFGGLGIEVTMENGFIKIISPIDDTPAQRAGMKAGDIVIRLNEKPVKGMTLAEAVKAMRGKPGSNIVLTVIREREQAPLKVSITRAIIKIKSVKSRLLEKDYGYVRISKFQRRTGSGVVEAVTELKKENKAALKGLVLDLRNNPGGVLNAAVEVGDAFLEKGLIVYTDGRIKNSQMRFSASPGDVADGIPIVVLINSGSASASEIVAGALQDHKRAIVMGAKSFGKGSVQTILPMNTDGTAAIKLTTARYYTPSGRSIQVEGIKPDIELVRVKLESLDDLKFKPIKEVDLSRHLENNQTKDINTENTSKKKKSSFNISEDYPLHEALVLLKGLNILHNK